MSEENPRQLHTPVLVLNATYEPINVTPVRRAIVLVLKGVATTEEENGSFVHSARVAIRIPSVIRLTEFRRIPYQTRALSRKNILLRDRYTCQFCGRVFPAGELTLDHVIPRSRGGHTDWDNLVACCHACNNLKGIFELGFAEKPRFSAQIGDLGEGRLALRDRIRTVAQAS